MKKKQKKSIIYNNLNCLQMDLTKAFERVRLRDVTTILRDRNISEEKGVHRTHQGAKHRHNNTIYLNKILARKHQNISRIYEYFFKIIEREANRILDDTRHLMLDHV